MLTAKSITSGYPSGHDPAYVLIAHDGRKARRLPGVDDADDGPRAPRGVGTGEGAGRAVTCAQPADRCVVREGVARHVNHPAHGRGVAAVDGPDVAARG